MQGQLPRHEEHEKKHKLRVLRAFVVKISFKPAETSYRDSVCRSDRIGA